MNENLIEKANLEDKNVSFFVSQNTETLLSFIANPHEFIKSAVKAAIAETSTSTSTETSKDNDLISLQIAHSTLLRDFYSKQYLYELVRNNAIPSLKIGKKVVFSRAALLEWIAAGRYDYGKAQIEKAAIAYVNANPSPSPKDKKDKKGKK